MATELKTPELSRHAAAAFAERWKNTTEELQHAQSFWADFFRTLCGIEDEKLAGIEYQKKVKGDVSGNQEYIDVYWKNVALIEHKSAGKSLDKAELQARGYLRSLPPGYRPKTIIVSDFVVIRIIDVALNRTHEFPLSKLPDNIHRFEAIISGNRTRISQEEITVDQEAARLMANLYLELEDHGFEGHETSIFLVRILFLLFGDDTGMWAKNTFLKLVMETKEDGTDIGSKLDTLFDVLNTPVEKRAKDPEEKFNNFPYVNGGVFEEKISIINFNKKMRVALVEVANYDWTTINPTIFGSLFQLIKDKEARRELGEHYTSEENINKIVYPLFLDELQERLASAWDNKKELKKLRQDLAKIKIFDPACGCGNFLVVSYRHLRQLELELIVRLNDLEGTQDSMQLDGAMGLSITLNQFYGIEIEEWPAQVARVALFLTDHQENLKLTRITGETQNRFPITDSATIIQGNALLVDWKTVLRMDEDTFILGNPPFIGMSWLSADQQEDNRRCFANYGKWSSRTGRLDYVACWYAKAIPVIQEFNLQAAFVSTNSITQGDQARVLAPIFLNERIDISFAHDTFKWISETADGAAVHVVVIGIKSSKNQVKKTLFSTSEGTGILSVSHPKNINIYLVAGEDILVEKRTKPLLASLPDCTKGSQPTDGGHLFVDSNLVDSDTLDIVARKYLRKFIGATEFLYSEDRWCLWLVDATPSEMKSSSFIKTRLKAVAEVRRKSPTPSVRNQADTPYLFTQIRQPMVEYLAMPEVSGHTRDYLPVEIFQPDVIVGNKVIFIPDPPTWLFGVISSSMFMLWVKTFAGRHGMSISISPGLTYFIFPFIAPGPEKIQIFERVMGELVAARRAHPNSTLADLYDPATMPKNLKDAHLELDALVDALYLDGKKPNNEQRLEALILAYRKFSEDEQLF
jgi:type I restriction-modification system DNA methylase subunit